MRAFYRLKGPKPRFDLMELRACAREGKVPPVAEGPAVAPGLYCKASSPAPTQAAVAGDSGRKEGQQQAPGEGATAPPVAGAAVSADATDNTKALAVEAAAAGGGHSHYGCPALMARLLATPGVLFPPPPPSSAAAPTS